MPLTNVLRYYEDQVAELNMLHARLGTDMNQELIESASYHLTVLW